MFIAFFDCETTGLPERKENNWYYGYKQIDKYNTSRIVQIALIVYKLEEGKLLEESEHVYIIKPDQFEIHNDHIHHISQQQAEEKGIPFRMAIRKMHQDMSKCTMFVSHNVNFDKNVILAELHRYGIHSAIDRIFKMKTFCTARNTAEILKLRHANENPDEKIKYKMPTLSELHNWLFGFMPEGIHDALQDTKIMCKCFVELFNRKLILNL